MSDNSLIEKYEVIKIRFDEVSQQISDPDVILLDPPRTGAGEEVITVMTRTHPRAIVYVSCDPASLARDAKILLASGYRMDYLVGYDLFPQTQHVECVARFIPA